MATETAKLKSRVLVERTQAVEVARREATERCDTKVRAADQQIGDARTALKNTLGELDATLHARRRELLGELVRDATSTFTPLVEAWSSAPSRPTAATIGTELVRLVGREAVELGTASGGVTSIAARVLADCFVEVARARNPAIVGLFLSGCPSDRYVAAVGALERAAPSPVVMYTVLGEVESATEALGLGVQGQPAATDADRRWKVWRLRDVEALAAHDASEVARARTGATPVPAPVPTRPGSRNAEPLPIVEVGGLDPWRATSSFRG
jgi:hypothetical protein